MNTKQIGNIAELKVAARFAELGFQVFFPFGENTNSDLVVENQGVFYRVQVKNVKPRNGVLNVPLTSIYKVRGKYKRHKIDKNIDYLICYSEGKMYCLNAPAINNKNSIVLRLDPAKGRGSNDSKFAKDYLF